MNLNKIYILIFFFLHFCFLLNSATVEPVWGVYSSNIMYSGQYSAFNTTKTVGYFNSSFNQTIYRSNPAPTSFFATPPKIILSLLGYKQLAPADGNTSVGFDVIILSVTNTTFRLGHNIYGANMAYLSYMYLAVFSSDYFTGQYIQTFNTSSTNKTYLIDISYNIGQTYPNYLTSTVQMKGFLSGYKIKQGTANGMFLNFSMKVKNSTFFTIQVSTHQNSVLQQITYYRIGYNRTSIQQRTYNDIFRDFYFQLTNNINTANISQFGWGSATEFQYRNFLMGTNKINIQGNSSATAVQFFLYYYFAESLYLIDLVYPPYEDNPAKAKYLYGEAFYHATKSCNNASFPLYLQSDRKCYSSCPATGYYTNNTVNICFPCHYSCRTCSQPASAVNCLSCDANVRNLQNATSKCICPIKKYDDGLNAACASCHSTCLTCTNSSLNSCKSCNSTEFRRLDDPDSDGVGQCICISSYYQNSTTGLCQVCSLGCIACTQNTTNSTICTSCNTTLNFQLNATLSACQCAPPLVLVGSSCINQICGDGILTSSQQCDDNNVKNNDGCSSSCKIQANHVCLNNVTNITYSVCYFNGTITMDITEVSKSPYDNIVSMVIKVEANNINKEFLSQYITSMTSSSIILQDKTRRLLNQLTNNLIRRLQTSTSANNANLKITSINFDTSTNILSLSFSYDKSFDISTKQIRFAPSVSTNSNSLTYFYNSPSAVISLQKTHNKVDTIFYDKSQYQKAVSFKYAFQALVICYWIICLLFIYLKKANVAMQMMLVLQITYVSLLSQQKIQITFGGLSQYGKYTAGYNIQFQTNFNRCVNFIAIQLNCSLIDNLNISFGIMVFLTIVYNILRLVDKFLNYKAEKQFNAKKKREQAYKQNDRTLQNIKPNPKQNAFFLEAAQEQQNNQQSSQSSQAIQAKYYKDKQFVPNSVYNRLLDFIYFLAFVTVMIWTLSLCFIKEQTTSSIVLASIIGAFYFALWIFWSLRYFKSDFSFVQAHKRVQSTFSQKDQQDKQQSQQSRSDMNQQENQPQKKRQKKEKPNHQIKKSSFTPALFKILFYPLIWISSLGLALVLALTESIGYVAESLIIGGSILLAVIIFFSDIYKQKMHMLRSILNCLILSSIQVVYIVSQKDNLVGTGAPITIIVYALLGVGFLSNSISTLYLYSIERKMQEKQTKANYISQLQKKIDQLEQKKRKQQIQDMGIFFKGDDASQINNNQQPFFRQQPLREQDIQFTVKKNPAYNYGKNEVQSKYQQTIHKNNSLNFNQNRSRRSYQYSNSKLNSSEMNMNTLIKDKVGGSVPYFPSFQKKNALYLDNYQQQINRQPQGKQFNTTQPTTNTGFNNTQQRNHISGNYNQSQIKYRSSSPSHPKQPKTQVLPQYNKMMSENYIRHNVSTSNLSSNRKDDNFKSENRHELMNYPLNNSLTNLMIDPSNIVLKVQEDKI